MRGQNPFPLRSRKLSLATFCAVLTRNGSGNAENCWHSIFILLFLLSIMQNRSDWQALAQERINVLFKEADDAAKESKLDRASRYVFLARKLAMKYGLRLSREQRRKFCHNCYKYLMPGKNLSVKINPKLQAVEYLCKECGQVSRYPYIREKKQK